MQTKHVPFEEIYDLLAVRIIFEPRNADEELNDCFDIYVSISKIYKPHPDRLRDWVSHPKANGYQALHVTLMGNNGQWIEVQIRSERMNDVPNRVLLHIGNTKKVVVARMRASWINGYAPSRKFSMIRNRMPLISSTLSN